MDRALFRNLSACAVSAMLAASPVALGGCSSPRPSHDGGAGSSESHAQQEPSGANGQDANAQWPENANTSGVPRPAFVGDAFVIDQNGLTSFTYSGVSSQDAAAYLQELKDSGFTKVEADTKAAGTVSYVARNVNTGTHLSYSYTSTGGSLTISLDRFGV